MVTDVLISGKKHAPQQLGRVLILGLGKSGRAVADYLTPLLGGRVQALSVAAGASAHANDETRAYVRDLRARGVRVEFDHECIEETYDLCIASPGISQFSSFYESAAAVSAEVVSEVEFAWRESAYESKWVAVTGTNGKTTTVALTTHVLREAGINAVAVGNIGETCLDAVAAGGAQVYVAEVSSYQLASTSRFAPNVAVLMNITSDHLSWHKSFEAYAAAKLKVLANLGSVVVGGVEEGASGETQAALQTAVAVLVATDDEVRKTVRALRRQTPEERGFTYVPVGTAAGLSGDMRQACGSENAAFLSEGGVLCVAFGGHEYDLVRACDLQIKGEHNVENALAAAAAALALGANTTCVARGLASFMPLAHRIEPCGEVAGVVCYNDSKATNVDATLKAIAAFGDARPIVLLGGRDKGTDLAPLTKAACAHAKAVVCFGEAEKRFSEAFAAVDDLQVLHAACLEEALDVALSVAQAGDIVLLSPACASFDEFLCFEERGNTFKALVARRAGRVGR